MTSAERALLLAIGQGVDWLMTDARNRVERPDGIEDDDHADDHESVYFQLGAAMAMFRAECDVQRSAKEILSNAPIPDDEE